MDEILQFDDIYTWQSDTDKSVFVDRKNSFLIYQNSSERNIRIIDTKNGNSIYSSSRFNKQICESILVSSDRNFLLYWFNDPVTIGISNLVESDAPDILLDQSHYDDSIVLKVFWSESNNSTNSNFVVISNNRVDIYNVRDINQLITTQFSFESSVLRTLNKRSVSCLQAWNDLNGTYFILLHHNKTLNPYKISNNEISQLPEIGLALPYGHQIQHYEICMATLYEETYCIYKDVSNGTLSLRSLTNNKLHDKVLEVKSQGWLEICVIDNLLLVLTGSGTCYMFDIAVKNDYLVAEIPQKKPPISAISSDIEAFIPNIVVDFYGGFAYHVTLDFNSLSLYLSRYFAESMTAEFFQRRMNCSDRIMEIVSTSIENKIKMEQLLNLFSTVIEPYSEVLWKLNKMKGSSFKGSAVPFNLIDKYIGNKSIITEHNFATAALYPYACKEWKIRSGANLFDFSILLLCYHRNYDPVNLMQLKNEINIPQTYVNHYIVKSLLVSGSSQNVPLDIHSYLSSTNACFEDPESPNNNLTGSITLKTLNGKGEEKEEEVPELYSGRTTPYIISVTLCYLKGLILHKLFPSNLLMIFLFDICVLYNNLDLVVHLIRAKVIRDSNYICYRLFLLYQVLDHAIIKQIAFDMSKRLKLYNITITILLQDKQYYKAVLLVKEEKLNYPISKILYFAANDVNEQKRKPYLWQLIISFLHVWIQEHSLDPDSHVPPNLKNCEMWLPNL